jgi:hypothetical protein
VSTLKVERWPRSARQFEAQEALLRKIAGDLPEPVRSRAGAWGRRLAGSARCVGVFQSPEEAAAAAPAYRARGLAVEPSSVAAREMTGDFTFGRVEHPGSGAAAWCRRSVAGPAEIWIQRPGEAPRRLLTGELRP